MGTTPGTPLVRLRRALVVGASASPRPDALELEVRVEGEDASSLAVAFPALVGVPAVGSYVIVNTSAVAAGLGTGGRHIVVAIEGGPNLDPGSGPGRVMKGRYLPHQALVTTVEETHAPQLEAMAATGLGGIPVVCAPLHSLIAPIAAGARAAGARRIVYVMTDGASLPGALSDLVPRLRAAGLLDAWITTGQAFGGELEAVTVWSGLLAAAAVCEADVAIVADGPGNLGTGTEWGVSALGSGHALDATGDLRGQAIAALRISFADERPRHRGVSHHSLTILDRVCHREVNVAVPTLPDEQRGAVWDGLRARRLEERHRLVEADGSPALGLLDDRGVEVRSMGRGPEEDPAFFLAGGAAGVMAGRLAAANARWRDAQPS